MFEVEKSPLAGGAETDPERRSARAPGFDGPRDLGYEIEAAIERGDLRLTYQPVMDLHTGRIVGAEALARWHHVRRGEIPPDVFIPLAERHGVIERLGAWALRAACRTARELADAGIDDLWIAVNAAADQFRSPGFRGLVDNALDTAGIHASQLEIEITETAFLDHRDAEAAENLRWLQKRGVKLAMDDFGTGYSSLAYLANLPVDKIKLDRAFLKAENVQRSSAAIIQAVAGLGRDLDLEVQAEGIETSSQATIARELGCTLGQGYQISPPLEGVVFHAVIEKLRAGPLARRPEVHCPA